MIDQPIPFGSKNVEVFWQEEEWDKNLPPPGFITDFVLATRGLTTPTKFCTWTALYMLSVVAGRNVELDWKPLSMYPNLYIFLVACPAFCGKSSVINLADFSILSRFHEFIEDPVTREKYMVRNIITSKCTAESLVHDLKPVKKTVCASNGEYVRLDLGSVGHMMVSELATFLGKQQYNIGLIQLLVDLYDCKFKDSNRTLSRGSDLMKHVYVTMIGGITPSGLEESIPESARGEGFLSRVILVNQEAPTRFYTKPMVVAGGPSEEELCKRLAWIAENTKGTYTFGFEIERAYAKWYKSFVRKYTRGELSEGRERDGVHLRKLALLCRMQRYEIGNTIEMQDFNAAVKLISSIQEDAKKTTITNNEAGKKLALVKQYVRRRGKVPWRSIAKDLSSRGILTDEIEKALLELKNTGFVAIELDGKPVGYPKRTGEIYIWKGEESES